MDAHLDNAYRISVHRSWDDLSPLLMRARRAYTRIQRSHVFLHESQQVQQKPASCETGLAEPRPGIDPGTSILPRWRSTTELSGRSGGRARSVDLTIMSRAL